MLLICYGDKSYTCNRIFKGFLRSHESVKYYRHIPLVCSGQSVNLLCQAFLRLIFNLTCKRSHRLQLWFMTAPTIWHHHSRLLWLIADTWQPVHCVIEMSPDIAHTLLTFSASTLLTLSCKLLFASCLQILTVMTMGIYFCERLHGVSSPLDTVSPPVISVIPYRYRVFSVVVYIIPHL